MPTVCAKPDSMVPDSLLSKMQVLPNEGSYAGRAVYRAANLYQAMDQFSKRRYDAALKSIKASEEWPENLGVGKPYDDQIDKRLEDYLEARYMKRKEKRQKPKPCWTKYLPILLPPAISNQRIC